MLLSLITKVQAQTGVFINKPEPGQFAKSNDVNTNLVVIMNYVLGAAAGIVVLFIIIGGFLYITSAGDEKKAEQGKNTITYAVVGLVVILLAYTIAQTVQLILL